MIGDRLRGLRVARGLSLRALAQLVGVSPTLLSQVERGVTDPSLATLRRLSDTYGVAMAEFFLEEPRGGPCVSRPGTRTVLRSGRHLVERLTPRNEALEVTRTVLEPGDASQSAPHGHFSVVCVYVVAGVLSADAAGTTLTVRAGEAITFPPGLAHRFLNEAPSTLEVLIATSSPTWT